MIAIGVHLILSNHPHQLLKNVVGGRVGGETSKLFQNGLYIPQYYVLIGNCVVFLELVVRGGGSCILVLKWIATRFLGK